MLDDLSPLSESFLYRPHRPNFDRHYRSQQWHQTIDHLIAAGYDFRPECFANTGCLFRGLSSGLLSALNRQEFGHYENDSETNTAEQIMQVFFVTHELSDAVSAARLHDERDNAIVVFNATVFNDALKKGNAAILNIGDLGLLFRYPFLTQPLKLSDISKIVTNGPTAEQIEQTLPQYRNRILTVDAHKQSEIAQQARQLLADVNIVAAQPRSCRRYPTRIASP